MYRASSLSYSELFPTKFNQIWDTFIKTRYYFSIFTLKYGEICIMINDKQVYCVLLMSIKIIYLSTYQVLVEVYYDTYRMVDQERYTALVVNNLPAYYVSTCYSKL